MESVVIGVWDGFIQLKGAKDFEFFVFERRPNFLVPIIIAADGRLDDGRYVVGVFVKRGWFRERRWYRKISKTFYWHSLRTATNEKFKSLGLVNESMEEEVKKVLLAQGILEGTILERTLFVNGKIIYSSSGKGFNL